MKKTIAAAALAVGLAATPTATSAEPTPRSVNCYIYVRDWIWQRPQTFGWGIKGPHRTIESDHTWFTVGEAEARVLWFAKNHNMTCADGVEG